MSVGNVRCKKMDDLYMQIQLTRFDGWDVGDLVGLRDGFAVGRFVGSEVRASVG